MRFYELIKFSSILFIISFTLTFSIAAQQPKKRILILHAYHPGFHWTDRIMDGINSVFEEEEHIELFVDYMDTKRSSSEAYFQILRALYADKYQFVNFDAIISSDDHALDFLLQHRDELFPNTPVIFSGLNAYSPERIGGQKGYTGIYESYDVAGTIELMLDLHPETQSIAAVTDDTRSGNIFRALIEKAESQFSNQINIRYLHNLSQSNLQKNLSQLPKNTLVLWAIYLRMPSGTTITSKESVKLVSEASPYPTYCIWDVVGQGVLGGKITSPNFQGETAAKIALKVLNGEPIENIPVIGSPLVNIFDYEVLERFELSIEDVPPSSTIINQPTSLYELYKSYIWIFSAIVILLITTIVFLITIILLKRNRDKLEGMAMHDQLTGLYNRHYLYEMSGQKVAEANRHNQSLCLLVLDLDLFKDINDTHGHLVGDQVLKKLARILVEQSRSEDIVARIGGEEFVILLDHCGAREAKEKAQQIRKKISKLNPNGIPVTVSIGIAKLNFDIESFTQLLERADRAVYRAKEAGRDCVILA